MNTVRDSDGEMKITPQMIEAGVCEAMARLGEPISDTVRAIYAAMEVERLVEPSPGFADDWGRIH